MSDVLLRLKKAMSYSQICLIKELAEYMGENSSVDVVVKDISDNIHIARAVYVHALNLLYVAGIIDVKSMGRKGTHIEVLDRDALEKICNF